MTVPPAVVVLHRVLEALNTRVQPSPADVRLLAAMVVELWDNRWHPYPGAGQHVVVELPRDRCENAE